jgi:hypothetical protein
MPWQEILTKGSGLVAYALSIAFLCQGKADFATYNLILAIWIWSKK